MKEFTSITVIMDALENLVDSYNVKDISDIATSDLQEITALCIKYTKDYDKPLCITEHIDDAMGLFIKSLSSRKEEDDEDFIEKMKEIAVSWFKRDIEEMLNILISEKSCAANQDEFDDRSSDARDYNNMLYRESA